MSELERRYRLAERRREVPFETRVFRGKVGVLLALQLSLILAAVTFAVDLRRLTTPTGVAQAWTEATVFGDCSRFLQLSVRAGADERRAPDELCAALRERTAAARTALVATTVTTSLVQRSGDRAVVEAVVERPGETTTARLRLQRDGASWVVVRDLAGCRVGCP